MKRKRLRKSDIRELNEEIKEYGYEIGKKEDVEIVENEGIKGVTVNGKIMFFYYDGRIAPTLKSLLEGLQMKKVTVDMGAVKFVVSGADIMRPGIVDIEEGIVKDDFVAVVDENNKKPLAVGTAMFPAEEMREMESGKAVRNIHCVGDKIWDFEI